MKKKKKKIFIRWIGFIPFIIIISLVSIGIVFFFDNFLKNTLENKASQYNQASVEIKRINSSIKEGQFTLLGLEWANREKLNYNLFEIGEFSSQVKWMPFLQKKVYFEEIKLTDFGINIKRKKKAVKILENEKAKKKSTLNKVEKTIDKKKSQVLDLANKKLNQQIEKTKEEINQETIILKQQKQEIEDKYQKKINNFSNDFQLEDDFNKITSFDYTKLKSRQDLLKAKKQLDQINNFKGKVKKVEKSIGDLENSFLKDSKLFEKKKSIINNIVEKNKKEIFSQMKDFTSLEGSISRKIFGNALIDKLTWVIKSYKKYSYLIPQKTAQEKKEIESTKKLEKENKRKKLKMKQGLDIHFPRTFDPPSFFAKNIIFTSKGNRDGILEGKIKNLSSDIFYKEIKNNIRIKYGDFYFDIQGIISGKNKINDKDVYVKQNISSDSFFITKYIDLQENEYVAKVTSGNAKINGSFEDDGKELTLRILLTGQEINFEVKQQQNKNYQNVLDNIFSEINSLEIKMLIKNNKQVDEMKIQITSNIDQIFQKKLSSYLKDIKKQQGKKLKKIYEKEINKFTKNLSQQIGLKEIKELQKYKTLLNNSKKLTKEIENKVTQIKKKEEEKVKQKLEKEKKKLLKNSEKKLKKGLKDLF